MAAKIDARTLKETVFLQKLLDQRDDGKRRYFYIDRLRTDIHVEYHYADKAVKSSKLYSTEINLTDYYIMYALLVLRIADATSIQQLLKHFKRKQPKLLINTDYDFILKRLKRLTQLGFLFKICYALNTKVRLELAYETERALVKAARDSFVVSEPSGNSYTMPEEEFLDEDLRLDKEAVFIGKTPSADEENFDLSYVDDIVKRKRLGTAIDPFGRDFKECFGKDAYAIKLYAIDDISYQLVYSVLHPRVKQLGWLGAKLAFEQVGIAAAGLVTEQLCLLPNFVKFKEARVTTKNKISFVIPSETEFKMGDGFRYNCGVFSAYAYTDEEKQLQEDARQSIYDKISHITNYIGIKGINKESSDAFVIVCVNDTTDLFRFADACMKIGIHEAEMQRLYFTGEGIVRELGLDKVLKMIPAEEDKGYQVISTTLPIIEK